MHHDFTLFYLFMQFSTKSQFSLWFSIAVHLVFLKDDDKIRKGLGSLWKFAIFSLGGSHSLVIFYSSPPNTQNISVGKGHSAVTETGDCSLPDRLALMNAVQLGLPAATGARGLLCSFRSAGGLPPDKQSYVYIIQHQGWVCDPFA